MSQDNYEATESLTENSEDLSETVDDLDLFDDDSSQEEDDAHEDVDWESRAKKAERKIVELKKSKTSQPNDMEAVIDQRIAEIEFYRSNPDAKDHEKTIKDYVKKGISLDKAYKLAVMDSDDENRTSKQQRSNRTRTASDSAPIQSQYTLAELEKMPYDQYTKVMARHEKGEIKIK